MSEREKILGILCSGRGSNLKAIIEAIKKRQMPAKIGIVLTDNKNAKALEYAKKAGISASVVERNIYVSKNDFEKSLIKKLHSHQVDVVILAGFMRILSPNFIREFQGKILNIHPSLLPAFKGAHAQRDALDYGVKFSGCTVHFVDEGMDTGPIILQQIVPVEADDTEETLAQRILQEEHILYPKAIELFLQGRLFIEGRKVHILPKN